VVTRGDVATISRTATQGQYYSYGARILLGRLYHGVVGAQWGGSRALAQVFVLLAAVVLALGLWLWLRHRSGRSPERMPLAETSDLIAFRMGALVYLGTFLVGNSFDYRLVFLLLTLPQLLRWPASPDAAGQPVKLPQATVAVLLVDLWVGTLAQQLRLWDELVSWTLAGMLLVLLARTTPSIPALRRRRSAHDQAAS
jgi:hypothetical protein